MEDIRWKILHMDVAMINLASIARAGIAGLYTKCAFSTYLLCISTSTISRQVNK